MGRRGYPAEFRRRVLDLLTAGRKVADLARDIGVSGQTIYTWRRQEQIDRGLSSEGRLTSACKASSCTGSGFDRLDMAYDGEGHRTSLVETPAAGSPVTTRTFRYQGNAVVEESVNGTLARSFVVDEAGSPVKVCAPDCASATYLPTWNGHGDLLALWRQNADGTLTLANSVTYDTWGRPTLALHNGYGDLGVRLLYVGRSDVWWDDAFGAGLLYMHARHYSPILGRFLQPDPAEAEGNLYGYAGNSPITKVDPTGEDSNRFKTRRGVWNSQSYAKVMRGFQNSVRTAFDSRLGAWRLPRGATLTPRQLTRYIEARHGQNLRMEDLARRAADDQLATVSKWTGGRTVIIQRTAATIQLGRPSLEGGRIVYQFRFASQSGVDQLGRSLYSVRVIVDRETGFVVNSYPAP